MSNTDFAWGLKINDALTLQLVAQISVIALGVAVICFIINVAYNYLRTGASNLLTNNEESFPDIMEIARCLVLFFCLTLYLPIAKTIVGTLETINRATSLTNSNAAEWAQAMNYYGGREHESLSSDNGATQAAIDTGKEYATGAQKAQTDSPDNYTENKSAFEKIASIATLLSPDNLAANIVHGIASVLVAVIQIVVGGIAVITLKILIILGPLVFAVSMLPCFQKQLQVWFGSVCSIGMAFTVINILNTIMWQLFKNMWNADLNSLAGSGLRAPEMIGIDLSMIGAYCSVFWLSSKIVGHGDAGRMISKTMGLVATAATLAIAGGAAAGSAATNVGKASLAGKSVITGDE
jgi:uncharacterized membrane protein